MKLHPTRIDDATRLGASVVAIGNFDGVHLGHQAVLAHVRDQGRARSVPSAVLTFDPHPAAVLGRTPPPLLTTLDRKVQLAGALGVDQVLVRRFDLALSEWSPSRFAEELLRTSLGARLVVVGDNFRFGHKRAGDLDALRALGAALGFDVEVFAAVADADGPLSSTRVRKALVLGEVERARAMLGRPHRVTGVVERGAQLGRTLGFPTANLGAIPELLPAHGVYAVRVELESGGARGGVMNLGVRPTVDGVKATQEVHLFDFDGDLYERPLAVDFVARIRAEQKFTSLDALKAQISADAARARELLAASATSQAPEGLA